MPATKLPKYRRQNVRGEDFAFVEINAKRIYLGKYECPESKKAYDRIIAEWLETGRSEIAAPTLNTKPNEISMLELCGLFWEHVEKYYRKPDGTATSEQDNYRQVLRPIKRLYAGMKVSEFGPLKLKSARQQFIESGMNRDTINKHTSRPRRTMRAAEKVSRQRTKFVI
jgi:hypothetical protein